MKKGAPFGTPFLPLVLDADTEVKFNFDAFMSSANDRYPALLCLLAKNA